MRRSTIIPFCMFLFATCSSFWSLVCKQAYIERLDIIYVEYRRKGSSSFTIAYLPTLSPIPPTIIESNEWKSNSSIVEYPTGTAPPFVMIPTTLIPTNPPICDNSTEHLIGTMNTPTRELGKNSTSLTNSQQPSVLEQVSNEIEGMNATQSPLPIHHTPLQVSVTDSTPTITNHTHEPYSLIQPIRLQGGLYRDPVIPVSNPIQYYNWGDIAFGMDRIVLIIIIF